MAQSDSATKLVTIRCSVTVPAIRLIRATRSVGLAASRNAALAAPALLFFAGLNSNRRSMLGKFCVCSLRTSLLSCFVKQLDACSMAKRLIPLLDRVLIEKLTAPNKSVGGVLLPESATSKVTINRQCRYWRCRPT